MENVLGKWQVKGKPLLFYIFIQPTEEFAVPDYCVLGTENLMGLILERH